MRTFFLISFLLILFASCSKEQRTLLIQNEDGYPYARSYHIDDTQIEIFSFSIRGEIKEKIDIELELEVGDTEDVSLVAQINGYTVPVQQTENSHFLRVKNYRIGDTISIMLDGECKQTREYIAPEIIKINLNKVIIKGFDVSSNLIINNGWVDEPDIVELTCK